MNRQDHEIVLLAPLSGPVVPIEDVPDPVFADKLFGDGIGLDPLDAVLVAPCDGTVSHLARTSHAVTLTTSEGRGIVAAHRHRYGRAQGRRFYRESQGRRTRRRGDRR